jgi:hypothetical protein
MATCTPTAARDKYCLTAGDLKGLPKPLPLDRVEALAIAKYGSMADVTAESGRRTQDRANKKRKREEDKKRAAEEKIRKEEEEKQRILDEQRQKEEQQKALRKQQATLTILQLLQQLSNASPENFDQLQADLAQALKTELPECGDQMDVLQKEADRVLDYAKSYVAQIKEQRDKMEQMRIQQEKEVAEKEQTAIALLAELEPIVASAEAASESTHHIAAPLVPDHGMEAKEVLQIARAVEEAAKTAASACSACTDFIGEKRGTIEEAEKLREEASSGKRSGPEVCCHFT